MLSKKCALLEEWKGIGCLEVCVQYWQKNVSHAGLSGSNKMCPEGKTTKTIWRFTWFGVLVLHPALVHHRQELVIVAFIRTACAVIRHGFFWVKDKEKMSQFNVVSYEPKTRGSKNISLGSLVKVGLKTIWQVDHPPCSTLLSLLTVVDHRLEGDVSVSLTVP